MQVFRTRPVDVAGSMAKGLQVKNALAQFDQRKQQTENQNALAARLQGGFPTDQAGRQGVIGDAAKVNPQLAAQFQTTFSNMDAAKLERLKLTAPLITGTLSDVWDQSEYDLVLPILRQYPDLDDLPDVYDRKQIGVMVQMAQHLVPDPKNQGYTLSSGQARYDANNNLVASGPTADPKRTTDELSLAGGMVQPRQSFDGGRTWENVGAPYSRRSNTPLVSIDGTREKEEQKARGKRLDASAGKIHERAESARNTIAQLKIARSLDVRTGGLAPLKKWAASYAASFGADPTVWGIDSATNAQAFEGIMNNLVLTKMQAQKGPQTENDAARIEQTLANLRNTPQANEFLFRSAEAMARRDIEQARFYEEHYAKNGTYDGADRAWDEFKRATPLLATDPDTGQTIFFDEFERGVMRVNRGVTRQQVVDFWRSEYGE